MIKHPGDGIYQSRCTHGPKTFFDHRNIYIQGNTVRLINSAPIGMNMYNFSFWFEVNQLGERLGDLPTNFDIHKDA